jgi:hypothetical protein
MAPLSGIAPSAGRHDRAGVTMGYSVNAVIAMVLIAFFFTMMCWSIATVNRRAHTQRVNHE